MKYLAFLRNIKSVPHPLHLVDVALFLSLLPHLIHLRFPMLVFLVLAVVLLILKKEKSRFVQTFMYSFGFASVVISFYSDFTFASLGKFTLFLSLLNAILIYAIVLQRLKGELNFYLIFSPAMLLVLSFFLHNSIAMLIYMVFVLYVFLLLLLWQKMYGSLYEAMRMSFAIFLYSLPVVALLFIVFPRISFEKAEYGFKDELVKRTGHDGMMSLGSDSLLVPSQELVMEVYFDTSVPKNRNLYFRGSTLYIDNNISFTRLKETKALHVKSRAHNLREEIGYKITLYPHYEKWVYALDIVKNSPVNTTLLDDYTIVSKKNIEDVYRYELHSYLSYSLEAPLTSRIKQAALQVDELRDIKSATKAKELIGKTDEETLLNIKNYFKSLELTYTLKPDSFDKKRPIDSFLFGTKKGYCVHFAAAFTYMARVAKLPTRVVSGYMINSDEAYEKYLIVRQNSAHAWVEVYVNDKGWMRVETTKFAKYIDAGALVSLESKNLTQFERFTKEINVKVMYLKYLVETWILEYSRVKQMQMLESLFNDSIYLAKFIASIVAFIIFSLLVAFIVDTKQDEDKILRLFKPLFISAKKKGYVKKSDESMHDFLQRVSVEYEAKDIVKIDTLYHKIKYSNEHNKNDVLDLKVLIKELK